MVVHSWHEQEEIVLLLTELEFSSGEPTKLAMFGSICLPLPLRPHRLGQEFRTVLERDFLDFDVLLAFNILAVSPSTFAFHGGGYS